MRAVLYHKEAPYYITGKHCGPNYNTSSGRLRRLKSMQLSVQTESTTKSSDPRACSDPTLFFFKGAGTNERREAKERWRQSSRCRRRGASNSSLLGC